ncbi:hypothetical protein LEL_05813 [Akanthomyces lecanii RCEF 1005]|uniref:Uncharacterized protein n=1 Tax=Akanthomyces lecanii RCEF 1005 TaxID=1081108 RepID=A0A162N637_CORDF|nr:hypothetical protein LEL_05813 [Akanthomyces lecanii RCEF 1005]
MSSTEVHVVSKSDNSKHATCKLEQSLAPLSASSIRVRSRLISLTSNNLTYARGGGPPLHWWDTYPVPECCPAPYSNRDDWGIVPAWGYADVVESTIDTIATGSLLWGFWPASGHAVQLQLEAKELPGHWKETSEHRGRLMTVYNHYQQTKESDARVMQLNALCFPLWSGPNLLNLSTFSDQRIHPLGFDLPWSAEDADISSAAVISLSASSKTGRSLCWELTRNRDTAAHGPLALLQLTSAPETLPSFDTQLPVKSASYTEIDAAVSWVAEHTPSRVVIVDFGASDATLQTLLAAVGSTSASATVVAVGYENRIYSSEELQARKDTAVAKVQLNTSGLRDRTIAAIGAERYYRESEETWARCVKDGTFVSIAVRMLRGVVGHQGIEGAWSDLCSRNVPPSQGLVIDLSEE